MSDPCEVLSCLQSSWSWEVGADWLLVWSGPSSPCLPMVVAKIHYILAYSSHHLWREMDLMYCVFVTIPLFIPEMKDEDGSHPDLSQQPNTLSSDMCHVSN